jgi:hypothetical protein
VLRTRPVLGAKALDAAHKALRVAVNEGRHVESFHDVRFKQSRLPVWSLTYMRRAAFAKEKQILFSTRRAWIRKQSKLPGSTGALAAFDTLNWGAELSLYGIRNMPISGILSFLGGDELGRGAWMSDETMDLGIGYINENLPPAVRDDVILAPTTFWSTIKGKSPNHNYRDLVNSGRRSYMYFSAIIGPDSEENPGTENHWIVFRLDFKKNIIAFGMSLARLLRSQLSIRVS